MKGVLDDLRIVVTQFSPEPGLFKAKKSAVFPEVRKVFEMVEVFIDAFPVRASACPVSA
jgi:hypothetical protein